jgi:orotidine-5'-phosphate decarboxylase
MALRNKLCFALDFPELVQAERFIEHNRLYDRLGAVKVGLELFMSAGGAAVHSFSRGFELPVVLDLKIHDIPETVARAVKVGCDMGVDFMTLHSQQRAALHAAVRATEGYRTKLLAVTVLTSMDASDFIDLGINVPQRDFVNSIVLSRAKHAHGCGVHGIVCSAKELRFLRMNFPACEVPFMMVPGIRQANTERLDQCRVGTPSSAVSDGADLLVVGRPIRDAARPDRTVDSILHEMSGEQSP